MTLYYSDHLSLAASNRNSWASESGFELLLIRKDSDKKETNKKTGKVREKIVKQGKAATTNQVKPN